MPSRGCRRYEGQFTTPQALPNRTVGAVHTIEHLPNSTRIGPAERILLSADG